MGFGGIQVLHRSACYHRPQDDTGTDEQRSQGMDVQEIPLIVPRHGNDLAEKIPGKRLEVQGNRAHAIVGFAGPDVCAGEFVLIAVRRIGTYD